MIKVNFSPSIDCQKRLEAHPLLEGISTSALNELVAAASGARARAGELLFREGDCAQWFALLCEGQVEMLRFTCDGEEHVFHLFRAGQFIAEPAMFMPHRRYPMTCRAQTDCHFYRIRRQALINVCNSEPQLAMRLLENFSLRLYRQVNELDWLTASSATQRLAAYLLKLQRYQDSAITLPINQRQLATHLGIRPETLSRLLSEWQKAGRINGRLRNWTLLDQDYLQQLASSALRSF